MLHSLTSDKVVPGTDKCDSTPDWEWSAFGRFTWQDQGMLYWTNILHDTDEWNLSGPLGLKSALK